MTDVENRLKVFCIGLNKTATSSLAQALEILGFRVLHNDYIARKSIARERREGLKLLSTLEEYEAFLDVPFDTLWRELDSQYPGSKFILTTRDMQGWLRSRENHVRSNRMNAAYRGSWLLIDKPRWERDWRKHHDEVYEYFNHRSKDLLVMDICAGDEWEKLCPFLDMQVPNCAFPKANVTSEEQASFCTPFIMFYHFIRVTYFSFKSKLFGS